MVLSKELFMGAHHRSNSLIYKTISEIITESLTRSFLMTPGGV